jgi:hypothetical protein
MIWPQQRYDRRFDVRATSTGKGDGTTRQARPWRGSPGKTRPRNNGKWYAQPENARIVPRGARLRPDAELVEEVLVLTLTTTVTLYPER